ncbi:MAG: phosphotransferase [Bacteroidales bacterium]|nr:phosphotransferase [Bacteroidales bacterium]MBR0540134.1 phosphotransferase [Bacteroidales bacterium]
MQTPDIQNILAELTRSIGETPKDILPIAESGSARKYFRVITGDKSLIGTYSSNIEENEAFLAFSKHFHDMGLNVPEVFVVNEEKTCYLQSDFGDDNLFAHVQKALIASSGPSTGSGTLATYSENVIELYKKALSHLVKLQVLGHQGLDYSKAYPTERFDRQAIIDDLNYFKYYFVKPHEEIDFNETRLGKDFEAFADFVSQAPCDFFMYRDFQSRNIMVKDGELYFIDFQGGRKGPLNYDVVSLLYQVKAQIPQATRDELVDYYKAELSQYINPEAVKFDTYQPYFVYLRLMQVLGAYGFRGLIQKKSHFIESIPYALREIEALLKAVPLTKYPELQNVINQLNKLDAKYAALIAPPAGKLTVTINSFSFKKGYPTDFSGNGGGFVFDCRALPNPGREPEFKTKTGRDWEVIDYLMAKPPVHVFLDHVKGIIGQSVDNYRERHFSNLMVSFGCTGGQHRSVFFAQTIYEWLKATYPDIHLKLNHIERKIKEEHNA